MLNVFLSSIFDDQTENNSDTNDIDFLIAKKHAVTREQLQLTPVAEIVTMQPDDPGPVLSDCFRYDTLTHRRHQAPDGYFTLDSGLSPPVSLS